MSSGGKRHKQARVNVKEVTDILKHFWLLSSHKAAGWLLKVEMKGEERQGSPPSYSLSQSSQLRLLMLT